MAQVVLENVYKTFQSQNTETESPTAGEMALPQGSNPVLRRINLTIADGEFMVLVGPSGCGKSTLLRVIAGLEALTGGNIWVGDRLVNQLPPKARDIAMVFQSYALYPHLSVYENLAFGLRRMEQSRTINTALSLQEKLQIQAQYFAQATLMGVTRQLPKGLRYRSPQEQDIQTRVRSIAQMLQIEALLHRLPKELSGGQKQRVALGRAMARNPQVFLMDEPLSNLDAKLRSETRSQIVNLQHQLGTTTIYVTHDQVEAMTMGDRIAVMNAGQIQQIATPLDLYHHPANRFVAEFIGSPPMNFLPVQAKAPLTLIHDQFRLTLPEIWEATIAQYDGKPLILGIRPEHMALGVAAPRSLPVQVQRVEALGSETFLAVTCQGSQTALQSRISPDQSVRPGDEIWLTIAPDKIHLFDPETEVALGASHS